MFQVQQNDPGGCVKNGLYEASDADYKISYGTRGQLLWPKDSPISEVSETLETISIDKANALIPQLLKQLTGDGEFWVGDAKDPDWDNQPKITIREANIKLQAIRAKDKTEIDQWQLLAGRETKNASDLRIEIERSRAELEVWKQQCATNGEVIHRLSGRTDNSLTAQAWICPNCHDDHSKISVCPEFARLTREREDAVVVYGSGEPSTLVWSKFKPSGISVNIHQARLVDIKEIK